MVDWTPGPWRPARVTQFWLFIILYPAVKLFGLSIAVARLLRSGVWRWHAMPPPIPQPFVRRIEVALQRSAPAAYCFSCLGTKLTVPVKGLLGAKRVLVHHPAIRVHHGVCHVCEHWEQVISAVVEHRT
jgi:hypothetical protein